MKKAFNSIFTLAIVLLLSLNFDYYSTIGRIVGYDTLSDVLYILADGEIWSYREIQDWEINDVCSMVFCDNGTEDVWDDDEVVYIRYIGNIDYDF